MAHSRRRRPRRASRRCAISDAKRPACGSIHGARGVCIGASRRLRRLLMPQGDRHWCLICPLIFGGAQLVSVGEESVVGIVLRSTPVPARDPNMVHPLRLRDGILKAARWCPSASVSGWLGGSGRLREGFGGQGCTFFSDQFWTICM